MYFFSRLPHVNSTLIPASLATSQKTTPEEFRRSCLDVVDCVPTGAASRVFPPNAGIRKGTKRCRMNFRRELLEDRISIASLSPHGREQLPHDVFPLPLFRRRARAAPNELRGECAWPLAVVSLDFTGVQLLKPGVSTFRFRRVSQAGIDL